MGQKKKFIDKKKSATFQLVARDSSDPNYDEGPSSDRVFFRVDNNPYSVDSFFEEADDAVSGDGQFADDPNSIFADAPDDGDDEEDCGGEFSENRSKLPDHIRREILELGFPDDGYNYLTHMREIKNTGGGSAYFHNTKAKLDQLPRDVKAYDASRLEISELNGDSNEKSLYNVATKTPGVRIQRVVDPEVAALLDDNDLSRFDSDVEDLEEDFVIKANIPEGPVDVELDRKLSLVEKSEVNKHEGNKSNTTCSLEKFEVNKHKVNNSNTSCSQEKAADFTGINEVKNHMLDARGDYCIDEKPRVRRHLDEQFDLLELQEYGSDSEDDYDGSLVEENECHEALAEKLNHAFKVHEMDGAELDDKYKAPSDLLHENKKAKETESLEFAADVIHRCKEYGEKYENDDQDENVVLLQESSDESEVWDCETIISTYSNLDNHPGKIEAPEMRRKKKLAETVSGALSAPNHLISLKGKEKLPVDFLPHNRKPATEKVKDVESLRTEQQKRKQHGQESKEEKKERKAAVKEERREARRVKKETKDFYRCEAHLAQKVAAFAGPSSIHLM